MKTYYIFRHGLATYRKSGYGEEIISAKLLPEGVVAIGKLAGFLKDIPTDVNFCSEIYRCIESAEIVTKITSKKFKVDGRLNEYSVDENYSHETIDQVRARVLEFLMERESDETNKTFLVCTHGAIISAIRSILTKGNWQKDDLLNFPSTGSLLIIHSDGRVEEKEFS
jgi:broad specificity phosphatase PhoE